MDTWLGFFMDLADWIYPDGCSDDGKKWPRWFRRLFLLSFPISIPIWGALVLFTGFLFLVGMIIDAICLMWK